MIRRSRTLTVILLMAATLILVTPLQAQSVRGTIQGYVTDAEGSGVPGVTITVRNVQTGAERTVFTNDTGFYAARALDPGSYDVTAALEGMATGRAEGIKLLVGQILDINLKIAPETVAEAITVTSEAPAIETSRTSAASYLSEEEIESLPIVGRDFKAFALLAPTVQADTDRGFITMSGQRGIYSGLNIDGTDYKSAFFGYGVGGEATENDGLVVAQDTVQEFQVVTSGFAPEYGANGGGYVNVVTKSGTNTLSGSAFYFYRDQSGASDLERSPLDKFQGRTTPISVSDFERNNWGLSIGGPIKKDRTHFFFSYDETDRTEPGADTLNTVGAYDAILARGFTSLVDGYTRNSDGTATLLYNREVSNLILFGKIDHQFTDSVSGSVRLNLTDYERISGFKDEESQKLEDTQSLVASLVSLHGSNAVNEARIQLAEDNLDRLSQRVGEPVEAQIRFRSRSEGRDDIGKFDFLPIFVEEVKLQFQDNFSYLFGNHDLKFGIDYSEDDLKQLFAGSKDGRYDFANVAAFLRNEDIGVRIYFGDVTFPNFDETQELIGIYAQDTFRPNEKLTVSYGLRFNGTYNPDNLQHLLPQARDIPDDENLEPRLGFAYSPKGDGSQVIRGGLGVFHGRTPSLLFASQVQENGLFPNFGRVFVSPGDVGHVPLGTPIDNENPPRGTIPSVGFVDPSFQDAEFTRFNVGYERQVGTGWTAGVDLVYAEGKNLQTNIDINRTFTLDAFGRPVNSSTRANPAFDEQLTRQSIGESEYQALTLKLGKRFNGRYQLQAHYTWSEDKDTDSNERSATGVTISKGGADRSLWDPMYDWGLSDRDVESRFLITGFVVLPWDFKLSGIFENRSGRPWTQTDSGVDFAYCGFGRLGFDCLPDYAVDASGNIVGRNTERSESVQTLDLRLSKFFEVGDYQIDLFVEVFNVFDEQAFAVGTGFSSDVERDPTSSTFGLADIRVNSQRQTQFGVRLSFN